MNKFIDANVIIKAFTINLEQEKCQIILSQYFVTNNLCLIEACDAISKITRDQEYAAKCIKSLFKSDGVIIDIDSNILFESLKRIGRYKLDIFDLIHYVTALVNDCSEFCSYDKDFDNLEIKRIEP
jgi:predicted nucleic acid-binding protein